MAIDAASNGRPLGLQVPVTRPQARFSQVCTRPSAAGSGRAPLPGSSKLLVFESETVQRESCRARQASAGRCTGHAAARSLHVPLPAELARTSCSRQCCGQPGGSAAPLWRPPRLARWLGTRTLRPRQIPKLRRMAWARSLSLVARCGWAMCMTSLPARRCPPRGPRLRTLNAGPS